MPLVAESLAQIPEASTEDKGRPRGLEFERLRDYRPGSYKSRSASPSYSETSETGATVFRSDSLHRPTPIPGEAAGTLSGYPPLFQLGSLREQEFKRLEMNLRATQNTAYRLCRRQDYLCSLT